MKFKTEKIDNHPSGKFCLRVKASLGPDDRSRLGINSVADLDCFDHKAFWTEQFPELSGSAFEDAWNRFSEPVMTAIQRSDGKWEALCLDGRRSAVFASHREAWQFIDDHDHDAATMSDSYDGVRHFMGLKGPENACSSFF